jgi:hypothetical protein
MAESLPPEVERLASFGRALEGTITLQPLTELLIKREYGEGYYQNSGKLPNINNLSLIILVLSLL